MTLINQLTMTHRPRFALWLKYHWPILRWLPVVGAHIWDWADRRVDHWHEERGR